MAPVMISRAPSPELSPWVSRIVVTMAEAVASPNHPQSMNQIWLCNDTGNLRTAVESDWTVETADGVLQIRDQSILCGQHSKSQTLTFTGSVKVAGLMLRPGAIRALWGIEDGSLVNRIIFNFPHEGLTELYRPGMAAEEWLIAIEDWARHFIASGNKSAPDKLSQKFEIASFADPNQSIAEFAKQNNVNSRTLQRIIKRDFGLSPKQVMRRARTLDLAAKLCGVATEEEGDEEAYLRFFDQSHQIREFIAFFGRSPREFVATRQGVLTLSLKTRQSRKMELLNGLDV